MRAVSRCVVGLDSTGVSRIVELYETAPIGLRMTRDALYVVSTAQGLLGDDDLEIEIVVEAGATLRVRSAAANVAYASNNARLAVRCVVESGASLDWYPGPIIATSRCSVVVAATIAVAKDGALSWLEECVLGRHGEEPGDVDLSVRIEVEERPLLHHQLAVGPAFSSWNGPAGIGTNRCVGFHAIVGELAEVSDASGAGWSAYKAHEHGLVVNALGDDLIDLRAKLRTAIDSVSGGVPMHPTDP